MGHCSQVSLPEWTGSRQSVKGGGTSCKHLEDGKESGEDHVDESHCYGAEVPEVLMARISKTKSEARGFEDSCKEQLRAGPGPAPRSGFRISASYGAGAKKTLTGPPELSLPALRTLSSEPLTRDTFCSLAAHE
ncbi:hypothetical protein CB1_000350066 [Camelus ferus]|nr:hypothetical protein CB1_000350066 [Camelus ferus]